MRSHISRVGQLSRYVCPNIVESTFGSTDSFSGWRLIGTVVEVVVEVLVVEVLVVEVLVVEVLVVEVLVVEVLVVEVLVVEAVVVATAVDAGTELSRTAVVDTTTDVDAATGSPTPMTACVPEKRLPTNDTARPPKRNPASERSGSGSSVIVRTAGGSSGRCVFCRESCIAIPMTAIIKAPNNESTAILRQLLESTGCTATHSRLQPFIRA